jgi:hypothetical protein
MDASTLADTEITTMTPEHFGSERIRTQQERTGENVSWGDTEGGLAISRVPSIQGGSTSLTRMSSVTDGRAGRAAPYFSFVFQGPAPPAASRRLPRAPSTSCRPAQERRRDTSRPCCAIWEQRCCGPS